GLATKFYTPALANDPGVRGQRRQRPIAMRIATSPTRHGTAQPPLYRRLYFQVLLAIVLGILLGWVRPDLGVAMKPLGDGFIKLIRMVIAPIIFATVVVGIAKMGDMKEVGRIGIKALVYFEGASTLALVIGLIVVNVMKPGLGLNADPSTLDP